MKAVINMTRKEFKEQFKIVKHQIKIFNKENKKEFIPIKAKICKKYDCICEIEIYSIHYSIKYRIINNSYCTKRDEINISNIYNELLEKEIKLKNLKNIENLVDKI